MKPCWKDFWTNWATQHPPKIRRRVKAWRVPNEDGVVRNMHYKIRAHFDDCTVVYETGKAPVTMPPEMPRHAKYEDFRTRSFYR